MLTRHPTLFAKNSEGKSPIDVAVSHEILQVCFKWIYTTIVDFRGVYQISKAFLVQQEPSSKLGECSTGAQLNQQEQGRNHSEPQ